MTEKTPRKRLEIEDIDDVTVVNFIDKKLIDEQNIQAVGDQLFDLVEQEAKRKVLLDFSNVEYFSSAASGKVITLHKKLQEVDGRLVLCSIAPQIFEVYEIQKLDKFFHFASNQEEALQWFSLLENPDLTITCAVHGCQGTSSMSKHVYGQTGFVKCTDCEGTAAIELPDLQIFKTAKCDIQVLWISLPTYQSDNQAKREGINLQARSPYALTVSGRLGLFASSALTRLWLTAPAPRRVILDCTHASAWSDKAIAAFNQAVAQDPESRTVIVAPEEQLPDPDAFAAGVSVAATKEEATAALGEIPEASKAPLMVSVSYS